MRSPIDKLNAVEKNFQIYDHFEVNAHRVISLGDSIDVLKDCPDGFAKLIITSPPYNIGKIYEKPAKLDDYLKSIKPMLEQIYRVLSPQGSLCWQVGNYMRKGELYPLDSFYYDLFKKNYRLHLRNRIIWYFDHGLHSKKRFSGRYETILWFTKSDSYIFNLDPVRIPSKYPGKRHFKGEKKGQPSGNPLGKNPGDIWRIIQDDWDSSLWEIPNVKSNHLEKTIHPCQFPIELVERCVLALTNIDDWVLDPFSGVGSAILAALMHNRKAMGVEKESQYVEIARQRIMDLDNKVLRYRPLGKPIYQPSAKEKVARVPDEWLNKEDTIYYK
jgi:adenine-specific DNA-methyltransferase